jgi:hypothetical protein
MLQHADRAFDAGNGKWVVGDDPLPIRAMLKVTERSIVAPEIVPMKGRIHGSLTGGTTDDARVFGTDAGGDAKREVPAATHPTLSTGLA